MTLSGIASKGRDLSNGDSLRHQSARQELFSFLYRKLIVLELYHTVLASEQDFFKHQFHTLGPSIEFALDRRAHVTLEPLLRHFAVSIFGKSRNDSYFNYFSRKLLIFYFNYFSRKLLIFGYHVKTCAVD